MPANRPILDIILEGVFASRPAAADALEYYATDTKVRYYSNGTTWSAQPPAVDAGDITTGTIADARIPSGITRDSEAAAAYSAIGHAHAGADITSGTVAAARLPALNSLTAPTGDVSINSHKLTNVTDPGSNQDAATKKYVDDTVAASAGDMATDPIWDAAGDLAVGTGANTAARLAIGATNGMAVQRVAGAVAWALPPGYEFDYVEFTSEVTPTATTEGTANTVVTGSAVAYDGSTVVLITFYCPHARPSATAAANYVALVLYDGSSSIGTIGLVQTAAAANSYRPVQVSRRLTPSNATHTYSIRAYVNTGTASVVAGAGGNGNNMPGFIRITKV